MLKKSCRHRILASNGKEEKVETEKKNESGLGSVEKLKKKKKKEGGGKPVGKKLQRFFNTKAYDQGPDKPKNIKTDEKELGKCTHQWTTNDEKSKQALSTYSVSSG